MRHACLLALLAALAVALVPRAGAGGQLERRSEVAGRALLASLHERIAARREETWRWQRLMQRARTPGGRTGAIRSLAAGRRALRLWRRRASAARREAQNPPHKRQWLCIHRYEAKWTDGDAPYYGGLQMDLEFQATYGRRLLNRKGTADHWTPLEQMWVAERAYRARGFSPWPTTARACGLL